MLQFSPQRILRKVKPPGMIGNRHIITLLTGFCLVMAAPCAFAETALASLTAAAKLIEQGEPQQAISKISEVFASGNLDNQTSAKAFLLRAQANEKLGRLSQALADYTNAMFMGLSATDRSQAESGSKRVQAALAKGEAGTDGWQTGAATTRTASSESQASSSDGFSFFGGLFGGSSSAAHKPEASPGNGWSQGTQVTTAAAAADDGRQYNLHLATLTSEQAAQSEAKRLAKRLATLLEGKTPEVSQMQRGGAIAYRVVAGPFEGKSHAQGICASLKAKGVSCIVIDR